MPRLAERRGSHRQRRVASPRWALLVPPTVAFVVLFAATLGLLDLLLGFALACGVVVMAVRRPGGALLALAVFLPLQKYAVALIYRLGAPVPVVRGAGWLKEALLIGILLAGMHAFRRSGRRADALDRVALLWLGGVTLYFLLPMVLAAPGAPESLTIRLQGYRVNAFPVLLLLGARHAPLARDLPRRMAVTLGVVIAVVAAGGVYQYLDPDGWIRFTQRVVQVPTYQHEVLGLTGPQLTQDFGWLYLDPVRVGSVLVAPSEFCDLLIIGLALAVERLTHGTARLPVAAAAAVIGAALVMSRTRVNLLAAAFVLVLLLRPAPQRVAAARVRIAALVLLGVALAAPFQVGTRITGHEGGAESSAAHVDEFMTGLRLLVEEPRGFGLGTAPSVGARYGLQQTFISDNSYLQVGNEMGVVMMLVFIALMTSLLLALRNAGRAPPTAGRSPALASALFAAGLGLSGAAMLHHVWISIAVSWTFFAVAGVALSRHEHEPGGDLSAVGVPASALALR